MISRPFIAAIFALLILPSLTLGQGAERLEGSRVQISADFGEADAVLAILAKRGDRQAVTDADWKGIFLTEPYQRLKQREASMHRDFADEEFKKFVLSDDLLRQREALSRTVAAWKQADLNSAARRVLQYLPAESVIRTKVFPVIKPLHNSFVFEADTNPAIFLYVDPAVSPAAFDNTVAHEMHHIGLSSVDILYEEKVASLERVPSLPPGAAKDAALWMGAFGEGEAMLAAAGGPDADPVATSTQEIKDNWARGKREFNADLLKVNDFFLQALSGKLQGEAVGQKASEFFGLQGPWYTVGYRMAVIVEERYGREALIDCMRDRRLLLVRYNEAAREINGLGKNDASQGSRSEPLALWSAEILQAVQARAK